MTEENLPAVPQKTEVVHSLEMPVAEFEGEMVRIMKGKLPSLDLVMDYGYRRGTHLKLELEVEIIRIGVDEIKSSSKQHGWEKGDLVREHSFAIREVKVVGAYTADQLDPGVGGGLAASGDDIKDEEKDSDDRPEEIEGDGHDGIDPDAGF